MVDAELLDILLCPETKQSLRPADERLLAELNASVDSGTLTNRGGDAVPRHLTEGLVREDGRVVYPVREGIPIVLLDEGIEVETPR